MGRKAITVEQVVMRDGLRCHYCREIMNIYADPTIGQRQHDRRRFTFEHVVPKSHGGSYGLYNIVGACSECNAREGNSVYKCFCEFCKNARVRTELKGLMI